MLASTFNILEDNEIYTDDSAAASFSSSSSSSSSLGRHGGKKGLGLRASVGPNGSNIKMTSGPQKKLITMSSKNSKSRTHRKSVSSSTRGLSKKSRQRAFGSVLATDNGANLSSLGSKQATKNSFKIMGSSRQQSAAARKTRPRLKPRDQNVTSIEVCHKGSGKYVDMDQDVVDLLKTNQKVRTLYRESLVDGLCGGIKHHQSQRSQTAPIDDTLAFGIFEDDPSPVSEEKDVISQDDAVLQELGGADLW